MKIPYVIDNVEHTLAAVLNELLQDEGRQLDVATAYFSSHGFQQPLVGAAVNTLRQAVNAYSSSAGIGPLLETLRLLRAQQGLPPASPGPSSRHTVQREDLHLVCFEYICS